MSFLCICLDALAEDMTKPKAEGLKKGDPVRVIDSRTVSQCFRGAKGVVLSTPGNKVSIEFPEAPDGINKQKFFFSNQVASLER